MASSEWHVCGYLSFVASRVPEIVSDLRCIHLSGIELSAAKSMRQRLKRPDRKNDNYFNTGGLFSVEVMESPDFEFVYVIVDRSGEVYRCEKNDFYDIVRFFDFNSLVEFDEMCERLLMFKKHICFCVL